jgi:hypothetical protein
LCLPIWAPRRVGHEGAPRPTDEYLPGGRRDGPGALATHQTGYLGYGSVGAVYRNRERWKRGGSTSGPALDASFPVHVRHERFREKHRAVRLLMILEQRNEDAWARHRRVVQSEGMNELP